MILISLGTYKGPTIVVKDVNDISIGGIQLVASNCAIIDGIFLWCAFKELLLLYFESVYEVFHMYRVSFK